jgi:2-oxoglutarate dehydrogenase E2 component (dihydrolipoamide succinyltransferase)
MPIDIKVPSVGESITEGTVSRWLKKDGEVVHAEEPLFELETEKATTEVAAPIQGILHITVPEGQTVPIGSVIGRIDEAKSGKPAMAVETKDGAAKLLRDGARTTEAAIQPAAHEVAKPHARSKDSPLTTHHSPLTTSPPHHPTVSPPLSPEVRRLIRERGIDASQLHGTGPRGRVTREDVLGRDQSAQVSESTEAPEPEATTAPQAQPPAPALPRERRQRMSSIRQRIAERLVAAQRTAAMLTTFNEADLTGVNDLRKKYKDPFQKKHGVNLGFMSFFVRASVEALSAFPIVNAQIDGGDILFHEHYNIAIAVSTDRGLMVPVLRDADRMSFAEIERRLAELAEKARTGKIAVDDLQGGTFTITNGGVFGSLLSTPILNSPQSAILGMHAIQKRPVVRDDQIVVRPMMYLALSYDHRLIDGRDAVQFLVRVKECVEHPERILLEI